MLYAETFAAHLAPLPDLELSQWTEDHGRLSTESSAQAGKWRPYPYQPGIMDALTDSRNESVTLMKSTRVGYTKIINFAVGYHIHYDPCPQMVVQPTVEDAEGYSKEEIAPMIRDMPVLTGLVADSKSRTSNNTILRKLYPGGFLVLVGANSARGFRRLTVRNVYFDEVDGYPVSAGVEGDQIKLGTRRTETYWNRMITIGGTPTLKHFSRVERHFLASDQRRYHIPCPTCKAMHVLKWKNFVIPEKDPARAHFQCPECKRPIDERDKFEIMARGQWIAGAPYAGNAGFHIWAAYSYAPKTTWPYIAKEFLESKDDPVLLRVFINTILGETFEDKGEAIEVRALKQQIERYEQRVDARALLITAGVDVQNDRLEMEIVAWGRGFESWSLNYIVIPGDPHFRETWNHLDKELQAWFVRADGLPMRINATFIDSGFATQEVYRFAYPRQPRRVFATKGQPTAGHQLVKLSKQKYKRGLKLFNIATIAAKDKIFAYMRVKESGPGFCHFPDHYGDDYFEGLTSEERHTKITRGVAAYYYRKVRTRNEPLDCRVEALAACEFLAPDWAALARNLAKKAESFTGNEKAANQTPPATTEKNRGPAPAETKPRASKQRRPRRRKGFIHDY